MKNNDKVKIQKYRQLEETYYEIYDLAENFTGSYL